MGKDLDLIESNYSIGSTLNSSTTLLTASSTFTGTAELNDYPNVMVQVATDQNGTLYYDFSNDGTNWDTTLTFYYDTNRINPPHNVVKSYRYFRVRFKNTSTTDQTYLRLYTTYGVLNTLTSPINATVSDNFDATIVRPTDYFTEVAMGKRQGRSLWNKFGYNNDVDSGTEVIASWGGTFTPLTTATTLTISSTDISDTSAGTGCNSIVVYGVDANRNEQIEVITMNGTTDVITVSTWLGINRVAMFLCGTDKINNGEITITATTGGSTMAQMPADGGVTQQCIFHVPQNFTFVTKWLWVNVINKGKDAELTVKMWVYSPISNGNQEVFKLDIDTQKTTEPVSVNPDLPFPISEKSVIWLECTSNKADVIINARFSGINERIQ